jgi:hypothetical protein
MVFTFKAKGKLRFRFIKNLKAECGFTMLFF